MPLLAGLSSREAVPSANKARVVRLIDVERRPEARDVEKTRSARSGFLALKSPNPAEVSMISGIDEAP